MGRLRRLLSRLRGPVPGADRPVTGTPDTGVRTVPAGLALVRAGRVPVSDLLSFRGGLTAWQPAPRATAASMLLPRAVPVCSRRSALPAARSLALEGGAWPQDLPPASGSHPGAARGVPPAATRVPADRGRAETSGHTPPHDVGTTPWDSARAHSRSAAHSQGTHPVRATLRAVRERLLGRVTTAAPSTRSPRPAPQVLTPAPTTPAHSAALPARPAAPQRSRIIPPWFRPQTSRPGPDGHRPDLPDTFRRPGAPRALPCEPAPRQQAAAPRAAAGPTEHPPARPGTPPAGTRGRDARPRADGREESGPYGTGRPLTDRSGTPAPPPPFSPLGTPPPNPSGSPAPQDRGRASRIRPAPHPALPTGTVMPGDAAQADADSAGAFRAVLAPRPGSTPAVRPGSPPARPVSPFHRATDRAQAADIGLAGHPGPASGGAPSPARLPVRAVSAPGAAVGAASVGSALRQLPPTAVPFLPTPPGQHFPAGDVPQHRPTTGPRAGASPPARDPQSYSGPGPISGAPPPAPATQGPRPGRLSAPHVLTGTPTAPVAVSGIPGDRTGPPRGPSRRAPAAAPPSVSGALVAEVARRIAQAQARAPARPLPAPGADRRPWPVPPGGHTPWHDRPPR